MSAFPKVLSPLVSPCLPSCFPLSHGVSAFPMVLSPLVSPCPLVPPSCFPLLDGVFPRVLSPLVSPLSLFLLPFVGWCVRLPEGLVSPCFPLLAGVRPPSRGSCLPLCPLVSPCVPFSPLVSPCVPLCPLVSPCVPLCHLSPSWMVCLPSPEFCLPLSPFLFPFVGWCLQPEGLVSPFLPLTSLLPLLVSLCWMVCPPSGGDKLAPLVSPCLPSWSPSGVLLGVLNAFLRWPPWC